MLSQIYLHAYSHTAYFDPYKLPRSSCFGSSQSIPAEILQYTKSHPWLPGVMVHHRSRPADYCMYPLNAVLLNSHLLYLLYVYWPGGAGLSTATAGSFRASSNRLGSRTQALGLPLSIVHSFLFYVGLRLCKYRMLQIQS